MPERVPTWANGLLRFGVPALGLGVVVALIVPMIYVRAPWGTMQYRSLEQPIAFDHNHHFTHASIDCLYCHTDAERAPTAGVPATEICMGCHRQVWRDSPILSRVRESFADGTPLPWQRVNSLPQFVFFNHSIHIHTGVGCSTCHGQVGNMPRVYQKAPLTMAWCLDCHRDPTPNLRPRDAITAAVWHPPAAENDREAQERLAAAYQAQSLTFCTTCHR